jgi:hypothetical protein
VNDHDYLNQLLDTIATLFQVFQNIARKTLCRKDGKEAPQHLLPVDILPTTFRAFASESPYTQALPPKKQPIGMRVLNENDQGIRARRNDEVAQDP